MSNMSSKRANKRFSFTPTYQTLEEILTDQSLAALGDAYTNLIYSLYLSIENGKPTGAKVSGHILSNALKQTGIRNYMSSRTDRHRQADAAEALLVYVWLQGFTTIAESVATLIRHKSAAEAFSSLLSRAKQLFSL